MENMYLNPEIGIRKFEVVTDDWRPLLTNLNTFENKSSHKYI